MNKRRKTPLEIENIEVNSCTIDLRMKIIHGLPFFQNLSDKEISQINKSFSDTHYNTDDIIYLDGEKAARLCVIASGSVKLVKQNRNGNEILIDILKPGEFFGNLDPFEGSIYQETAVVQTQACIMKIDTGNFRNILNTYPSAALTVLDITLKRLRESQEIVKQLSSYSVESRVAYTLLKLSEKLGEEKDIGLLIQIPLSRNDIAGMTGTTPETASRILSRMQKENIIQTGRKWLAIKNIDLLNKMIDLK
ncbi:MAG: Crp/Fnr family transcriptional regulator [Ignavibacteriae bacterium]|nr:Crp/Fnr family transcriptional regulator [Ignavibacteriota bacterium]NOG97890.1 Crp/Fnr family transcriptional regulator [Ignavibacteriota bacterium]